MRFGFASLAFLGILAGFSGGMALAGDGNSPAMPFSGFVPVSMEMAAPTSGPASAPAENQYGPFGLFDRRSNLGNGFFPEPFLVDEGDLDKEVSLDWIHQEGKGSVSDFVTAEVEWSFGLTTIEVEGTYERDTFPGTDEVTGLADTERTEGIDSVEISVRHPIWEWISADETVENNLVAGFELAVPSNSVVGKDTEMVPQVFDLTRIGDHFGLQTHVGYSTLFGSDDNNKQTLEYSADFSYEITSSDAPLPKGLLAVVPIIELAGERGLNEHDLSDSLNGVLGVRFMLNGIGTVLPRLGIGYITPIDKQARDESNWGIVTSLTFDL